MWNRLSIFFLVLSILGILGSPASQAITFQADFEGDLSAWTGGGVQGLPHSGVIVSDPFDSSNRVLTFSTTTWGGDIFTAESFGHADGASFRLSWDYLGLCGHSDCGGLVGVWDDVTVAPDHDWLAGSHTNYPNGIELFTPDTGNWSRFSIDFVVPENQAVFLMLEDFVYAVSSAPNDVYFDNIELNIIPEPTTVLLLGLGLVGLSMKRRAL